MTFWFLAGAMILIAIGFIVWPLYKQHKGLTPLIGVAIVFVAVLSAGLYFRQGSPDQPSGSGTLPEMNDAVAALAARLAANPDDATGWKMLGRSYMTMGDYGGAVDAFEKAVELDSAEDAPTLISLGEALLASTGTTIDGRIAALFENALALEANNPQALFYGGIAAFNRNDKALAADRWEQLLALNPPAEIQGILQQRIAEWRGEAAPAMAAVAPEAPPAAAASTPAAATAAAAEPNQRPGVVVSVQLSLTAAASADLPDEATVFVIARDPAQPVPPIAVARRRLSELPMSIDLGDRESMVPGRELSGFDEFELVARVSLSGQPSAQPGDWFGTQLVTPAENSKIELAIQEQVP